MSQDECWCEDQETLTKEEAMTRFGYDTGNATHAAYCEDCGRIAPVLVLEMKTGSDLFTLWGDEGDE